MLFGGRCKSIEDETSTLLENMVLRKAAQIWFEKEC